MKKLAVIIIIGIVVQSLMSAVCYADVTQMLSPALQLELKEFQQGLAELTSQPAVDTESSIIDVVYGEQAAAKTIEKKPLERIIRSRDLLAFDEQEIFKMDYFDYPVPVTDKVIVEELGYCSGMVIASGNRLWLRRYPEESYIMEALEADINRPDSEKMFNKNTRIVLLNTSYGAWKWYLEQVQEELVKKGVRAENIVMSSWDDNPQIDGVGIYLFPTGQVVAHKKNFSLGVTKIIRYKAYLENHQSPDIIDRHGVEEIIEFVSSRNLLNNSISSNPVSKKLLYLVTVDQSI